MKSYKILPLAVMFLLITACGAGKITGGKDTVPTELDNFATKLASGSKFILSGTTTPSVSDTHGYISADGKTITATKGNPFDSSLDDGDTWTLKDLDKEKKTMTYSFSTAPDDASEQLVLQFLDMEASPLVLHTTSGIKYGNDDAMAGVLITTTQLFDNAIGTRVLKLDDNNITTELNAATVAKQILVAGVDENAFGITGGEKANPLSIGVNVVIVPKTGNGFSAVVTFVSDNPERTITRSIIEIADIDTLGGTFKLKKSDNTSEVDVKFES